MEKNHEKESSKVVENEVDSSSKEDEKKEFVSTVDTRFGWENTFHSKMIDEWKSRNEPFVDNLVEDVIQQMAHQKIIAGEKEGSIIITPERIDILIQMVEENKDKYEHYETYLDILKRWKKGDFSTVDNDHNVLMRIQGSKTGGVATGIATEEQEVHYIFQVFAKQVDEVFGSTEKHNETESEFSDPKTWKDVSTPEGFNSYGIEPTLEAWIAYHAEDITKTTDVKEYYPRARRFITEMKYFRVQGEDLQKDFANLMMLQTWISHLDYVISVNDQQGIRTAENYEEMKKSFKYFTELLHDIDIVINHDGKGETFGFAYQLDGKKVQEIDTYIHIN
ncbi:hypothetical protein PB01_11285 [Psychrobacillus glaciei]|uniref:Uncharacterized protein n=1 Tax=Psychrobacillus glaciei TaxID=2283160 RepID=A0A5J6SNJ2_9BACI|nr:DUF6241 domain-containing protein [Psychrobacillus glaciei]QFF99359.1 hypothetical protein PB01_11285 [Psychrobacillus glaciei]